jgi:alginate O-acetyltransferase complex protein AlgI
MLFTSYSFIAFMTIVFVLYYLVPKSCQWPLLLVFSYIFYFIADPRYLIFILVTTISTYLISLKMNQINMAQDKFIKEFKGNLSREQKKNYKSHMKHKKWIWLLICLFINIGILSVTKYTNFVIQNINDMLHGVSGLHTVNMIVPMGISFYTFQAISYLVDVYRGTTRAQNNLINFALYIAMFPQLIAGPIVRYEDVEQQIRSRKVTIAGFGVGCEFFIRGMVKKVLFANLLGQIFVRIQALSNEQSSIVTAWIGAILYTLQIYYDFSGYSDMAIGLGRMFGFRFPQNFNYPYIAESITDFWRRWHMTLGTWFREYVYIPLGGNRVTTAKHIRNLLIVWGLTGVWHGAGINFLLWGLYYGVLLIIEKYLIGGFLKKHKVIGHTFTLIAVVIGWMLFANTSFASLGQYFCMMFGIGKVSFFNATAGYFLRTSIVLLVLGVLFSTPIMHQLSEQIFVRYPKISAAVRVFLFLLCIAALVYQTYNPFLYFRF